MTVYQDRQPLGLSRVFKNSRGKVLEFFIRHLDKDYSIGEISKGSGVSSREVYRIVDQFTYQKIIIETRRLGKRIPMYTIVRDVGSKALIEFDREMLVIP